MVISNSNLKIVLKSIFYFIIISFNLAFAVSSADIPYFNQFFSRFSVSAFKWVDSPRFVFKMIFEEPLYWLTIIPFILFSYIFYYFSKKIWKNIDENNFSKGYTLKKLSFSLIFLSFLFVGMRGRIEGKSPIRVGTAYFSNNAFLNQLGLNPNFTLIHSFLDFLNVSNKPVNFMNNDLAISNVQKSLNIIIPNDQFPILRKVFSNDSLPKHRYNVILVIMESMSTDKLKRGGSIKNITPFIDSLADKGLYFENIYTSGCILIMAFSALYSLSQLSIGNIL